MCFCEREREYNGFRMVISKKSFLLYFLTNERFSDCEYVWMTLLITLTLNITQRERRERDKVKERKWITQPVRENLPQRLRHRFCSSCKRQVSSLLGCFILYNIISVTANIAGKCSTHKKCWKSVWIFLSTKNDAFKAMTITVILFVMLSQHCFKILMLQWKKLYKTVSLPWLGHIYAFAVFDKNLQMYYCLYLIVLMSQITTVCTEHFHWVNLYIYTVYRFILAQ